MGKNKQANDIRLCFGNNTFALEIEQLNKAA
jgi:hypothetical protein